MTELSSCRFRIPLLVLVGMTLALGAWAQSTTAGGIHGVVKDEMGAVIPGAAVTLRNVDTNNEQHINSGAEGEFRLTAVTPGNYAVEVTAANFAPYRADGVIVQIGVLSTLEIKLGVAGKVETVEVTGEMTMVNTAQADFANNITQAQIQDLPTNGRRWSNFALLTPGAVPGDIYGLISFRGISGLMNNATVDGGDNNQAFFSEERGRTRTNYVVSQASVREFQVNTSNYSAEYGRAAGAVVNTVTKSGTNSLHGEGFWYIRDNELGATNSFTTHLVQNAAGGYSTEPFKPTDRRQQFGGSLGGPLVKDKFFFFFNYDGQRQNIPGVAMPSQPLSLFGPATTVCASPADATFSCSELTAMSKVGVTQAQAHAALDFLTATTGTQPRTNDQNIFFPKLDWTVNQNNSLSISYNRLRRTSPAGYQSPPVVGYGLGDWGDDGVKVDMVNARLSSAIRNTISNELRFSWGRELDSSTVGPQNPAYQPLVASATSLFQGMLGDTYFSGGGASYNIGLPYTLNRYAYPDERKVQVGNSTSIAHGKHTFKFGGDFLRTHDLMNSLFEAGGDYSYSSRQNWIIDYTNALKGKPSRNYSSYAQGIGVPSWKFNTYEYAGFFNDDFRVSPRLTLNLGVRYEYQQLPEAQIANPALPLTGSLPSDRNNFAPRVGFALDLFGNAKTVLRGGYGIYYGRFVGGTIANALYSTGAVDGSGQPLGQATISYKNTNGPLYPNTMPTSGSAIQNVAYFAHNAQNPQIHQADVILERQIANNTVISASYLMSLGREMANFVDQNEVANTATITENFVGGAFDGASIPVAIYQYQANPKYGHMYQIVSNVNSSYNALAVQANRRMTHGLQFQASYTWSHTIDSGQNSNTLSLGNNYFDPFNMALERGNSNWDIRHRVVGSAVWQPQHFKNHGGLAERLLDGWSMAPIVTFSSGIPFTESVSGYPNSSTWPSKAYAWSGSSLNESGGTSRIAPLVGRNNWRYPWLQNIDLRLSRRFHITERHQLELMADAFNLFNHRNTTDVNSTMYNMCGSTMPVAGPQFTCNATSTWGPTTVPANTWLYNPSFGSMTKAGSTLYRERQVQFAVRYRF